MSRTAEASGWKTHEDEILYSIVTSALALNMSATECYQKASEVFQQLDDCTNREWNACRQRWAKIKHKMIMPKEIEFNPNDYMPPTTGVQEELDFGIQEEEEMSTEEKSVLDAVLPNNENQDESVTPMGELEKMEDRIVKFSQGMPDITSGLIPVPITMADHVTTMLQSLTAFQLIERDITAENELLREKNAILELEKQQLLDELATFRQIQKMIGKSGF